MEVDGASQPSDMQQLSLRFGPSGPNKHRMWSQQVTVLNSLKLQVSSMLCWQPDGLSLQRPSLRLWCERLPARGQTLARVMEWSVWTRRARGAEGQGFTTAGGWAQMVCESPQGQKVLRVQKGRNLANSASFF